MTFLTRLPWLNKRSRDQPSGQSFLSDAVMRFAVLWFSIMGAERLERMKLDERLVTAAQDHAAFLSQRSTVEDDDDMHIGAGDSTAHDRVRAVGYHLPDYWPPGNYVESCYRGSDDPAKALEWLLQSENHRPHLLGEGFWEASTVFGIGHIMGYWVILICPPE